MKKILLAASLMVIGGIAMAQTPEDALRYSWLQTSGTARSQAIGNANGAIGGEISTIFSNPANIGFYQTGDFVISGGGNFLSNNSTYLGASQKANQSSGFLGTTGLVLGKPSYGGGSLKSSAFGIAVNRLADFNNRIEYTNRGGQLSRTSMANYFFEDIVANNGLNPHGSELAVNSGWITETQNEGNTDLSSPAVDLAVASGLEQQQIITTSGGITELAIAGAANLNDKVYIGGTIGIPMLRVGVNRQYTEQDPGTENNGFETAWFDDDLITRGVGLNVKAGVVFKATDNLRLGFAAHSPTFYSLSDSYIATAGANLDDDTNDRESNSTELVYDYNLNTPYKLMGSFSLLFGNVNDVSSQKGFISGDVEYVNYMASNFRTANNDGGTNNGYYSGLNNAIDNAYKGAVNARLGAELKFNTIAVRLGGAYYGNPYKDLAGEKGELIQGTGGLGYRNRGFFVDLGFVQSFGKDVVFPYRLSSANFYPAQIKSTNSRVLLTLGFKI